LTVGFQLQRSEIFVDKETNNAIRPRNEAEQSVPNLADGIELTKKHNHYVSYVLKLK